MKRLNFIPLLFLLPFCNSYAQDVIVKKDGSTILAKILTVGDDVVEYKKFNNPQGPTYKINVANLQAINYESGDKDTFDSNTTPASTATTQASTAKKVWTEDEKKLNAEAIEKFNANMPAPTKEPSNSGRGIYFGTFGVTSTSQIMNDDLSIEFYSGDDTKRYTVKDWPIGQSYVITSLNNRSDNTLYIDLANTFFSRDKVAEPYYIPKATGTAESNSLGLGVGGGVLGAAIGVGISSTKTNSTTVFSQRVVSIPPHSAITISQRLLNKDQRIGDYLICEHSGNYGTDFYRLNTKVVFNDDKIMKCQTYKLDEQTSPIHFGFTVTYSRDENLTNTALMNVDLYLKQIIGTGTMSSFAVDPGVNLMSNNWASTLTFLSLNGVTCHVDSEARSKVLGDDFSARCFRCLSNDSL